MARDLIGRTGEVAHLLRLVTRRGLSGGVVSGPPGVGKTRLGREVLTQASRGGTKTIRAEGVHGVSGIPFGAVAGWLPDVRRGDTPLQILVKAQRTLADRAGDGRLLAFIDDAHLLDEHSATLVSQLALADIAFVLMTVRTGASLPAPILRLANDDRLEAIRLGPLPPSAIEDLVCARLGGPMEAMSLAKLVRASEGNPLYISELVDEALERGALSTKHDVWTLSGSPPISSRLVRVARDALATLNPAEIGTLELIAVGEPLDYDLLALTADMDAVETLEERGMITEASDRSRTYIRVKSRLLATALRELLPSSKTRRLSGLLADARLASGARRHGDKLELARWQLASGRSIDGDALIEAARLALADYDASLAEQLARSALAAGRGIEAELELAHALAQQGRKSEADERLSAAAKRASTDAEIGRTAMARLRNATYLGRCPHAAFDAGVKALAELEDPDWKDALAAELSISATLIGDYAGAIDIGSRVADQAQVADSVMVSSLLASTISDVMLGKLDEAADTLQRGLRLVPRAADHLPLAAQLFAMHHEHGRMFGGDLIAAEDACRIKYQEAAERSSIATLGLWASHYAASMLFRGNVAGSVRMYAEAVGQLQDHDPFRALPVAQCWRALALAHAGESERSQRVLDTVNSEYITCELRVAALNKRATAWRLAGDGELLLASEACAEAGRHLIDNSHLMWGVFTLHDAVRFGHPELVADDLAKHAAHADGEFAPLLVRHAEALLTSNRAALDACGRDYERLGALLLAAETYTQAAGIHQAAGHPVAAARASSMAGVLSAQCSGARTPALQAEVRFLTERELEVAVAAARGSSNQQIADHLHISIRTVENHLASAYAKLGIHCRSALVEVIPTAKTAV